MVVKRCEIEQYYSLLEQLDTRAIIIFHLGEAQVVFLEH